MAKLETSGESAFIENLRYGYEPCGDPMPNVLPTEVDGDMPMGRTPLDDMRDAVEGGDGQV